MKKINVFITAILVFSVVLTLIPFLKPGLFFVHDPTSAFRLYTLIDTIKTGQFPAAWTNLLNYGFGYPIHAYYAPLFGYLGAAVFPFFGSYEVAIKIILFLCSLLGTFGVYYLLKEFGIYSSLIGAVAFTFLPYRASALYVRGSYAEFLAMSLLPWVIYFWSQHQSHIKKIVLTAVTTALFALSHNTLLILVVPIIIVLIALFQRKFLFGSILAILLSLGLTSWFILPVLFERNFVQVESVARITNFRDHFLDISQLWYSPWGYGGSAKGVLGDEMSFMVGKGQIILAAIGIVVLMWKKKWDLFSLYIFITLSALFLALGSSQFIWEQISALSIIQFPWRTLSILGLGISALAGIGISPLHVRWQMPISILVIAMLVWTNIKYFVPQEYRTYSVTSLSSEENLDPLAQERFPEYLPTWMTMFPKARIDDGLERSAVSVYGVINQSDPAPIVISTAYMPQWKLKINGVYQQVEPSSLGLVKTVNSISAGENSVELTWYRTNIEKIGLTISAISLLLVIGLLII